MNAWDDAKHGCSKNLLGWVFCLAHVFPHEIVMQPQTIHFLLAPIDPVERITAWPRRRPLAGRILIANREFENLPALHAGDRHRQRLAVERRRLNTHPRVLVERRHYFGKQPLQSIMPRRSITHMLLRLEIVTEQEIRSGIEMFHAAHLLATPDRL